MADKWAIISGNWSNASTWNGGTLPVSGDDVYADGKSVTIDQNIVVTSLYTKQRSGGTIGGTFSVTSNGIFITASIIESSSTNCLNITLTSGQICNVWSNIYNGTFSNNAIRQSGGILNLFGNVTCGSGVVTSGYFGSLNVTTGTTNLVGNVIAGSGSSGCGCILNTSSVLNLVGNVYAGTGAACLGVRTQGNSSIYATGSVFGGTLNTLSHGIYSYQNSTSNTIWGNIYGGAAGNYGVYQDNGNLNVIGNLIGGSGADSYGILLGGGANYGQTGSISGGSGNNSMGIYQANANLNIVGNVFGATAGGSVGAVGIYHTATSTNITITGTVSSAAVAAIRSIGTGNITINGSLIALGSANTFYPSGNANSTINGNQRGYPIAPIYVSGVGQHIVNGDILGATSGVASQFMVVAGNNPIIINGNITQLNIPSSTGLIYSRTNNLTINGNVIGGSSSQASAIYSLPTSNGTTIQITGNVYGGTNASSSAGVRLESNFTTTLTVNGNLVASSVFPAVTSPSTLYKTIVNGNIINTSGMMAFNGLKLNIGNTQSSAFTLQSLNGSNRSISTTNASYGLPQTYDVRLGATYGVGGYLTGTLAVPTASAVSIGVPVDNTVGTAIINSNDLGAVISGFSS